MKRILVVLTLLVSGCGAADPPEPERNTSTCYKCSLFASGILMQSYACTPTDAVQFGKPCNGRGF